MPFPLTARESHILQICLRHLRALPGGTAAFDKEAGTLALRGRWGEFNFRLLVSLRLSPATIELLLRQAAHSETSLPPLLFTDYLPEPSAAKLRSGGIHYVDAAGNAWVNTPPLYMEISGRKRSEPPGRFARSFQNSGLRLIYLLLREGGEVRRTYRELSAMAGVALGGVGPVLEELQMLGYIDRDGENFRVCRASDLLHRWELGYAERLRPRLLVQRCRIPGGRSVWELPELIREHGIMDEILVGGELGASLLMDGPTPSRAALHLSGDPLRTMLRLSLSPDPDGPVTLLKNFGSAGAWQGWQPEGVRLADPLLLHAELIFRKDGENLQKELLHRILLPRLAGEPIE